MVDDDASLVDNNMSAVVDTDTRASNSGATNIHFHGPDEDNIDDDTTFIPEEDGYVITNKSDKNALISVINLELARRHRDSLAPYKLWVKTHYDVTRIRGTQHSEF